MTSANERREDTASAPEPSPQKESRWKRPTLYTTIVGMYLLLLSTILLSVVGYFSYNVGIVPLVMTTNITSVFLYIQYLVKAPSIVSWMTFFIAGGPIIWAVPSVIGAVLLLKREKLGVFISLATLKLLIITAIMTSMFLVETFQGLLIAVPLIVSSSVTYVLLIMGWKRVRWK